MFKIYNSLYRHLAIGILLAITFTISVYSVHASFNLEIPIWGKDLIAPIIAGIVLGVTLGSIYHQIHKKENSLYRSLEQQKILKEISLLPHQNYSLEELLNKAIFLITSTSFAKIQSKGGIFLSSDNNKLELKSHLNFSPETLTKCGKNGLSFGECLCGIAAQEKKTIFKKCIDEEHSIITDTIEDHGHYNVPILYDNKVLGIIVVYLDVNHIYNPEEVVFLESIANILSIIIHKYSTDIEAQKNVFALKEIQRFSGVGLWSKNIKTGEISASKEVYQILGYLPSEVVLSETFLQNITHPDDLQKLKTAVENAKKGIPYEIEVRHYNKEGAKINVIIKCNPKVEEGGFVSDMSGIIVDVSKLRINEAELLEKINLVNGILSATPDPLYLLDLETSEFVYCNKAMDDVLLNNPDINKSLKKTGISFFRNQTHPDDLPSFDAMNKALRLGKKQYDLKFRSKVIDKTYRWLEQKTLVYKKNKNGQIKQVLIVSKDIHEKVLAENSVARLNQELVEQNNAIKKVNNELDQFVYSVSHDLRAPLASILGLINLSKFKSEQNNLEEYMYKIGLSTEKLDAFIKDILDYSRNARTEVEVEDVDLEKLIMGLIENIQLIRNADIDFKLIRDEETMYVGDRRRISIILNNLISNACKYADDDKPIKQVHIHLKSSPEGSVISIEDNGIGIKKEHLEKVYTMFYRGTEKSDGSGLGLYIVKETLEKLNGKISLESEEGVGTKVILDLPHSTLLENIEKKA